MGPGLTHDGAAVGIKGGKADCGLELAYRGKVGGAGATGPSSLKGSAFETWASVGVGSHRAAGHHAVLMPCLPRLHSQPGRSLTPPGLQAFWLEQLSATSQAGTKQWAGASSASSSSRVFNAAS